MGNLEARADSERERTGVEILVFPVGDGDIVDLVSGIKDDLLTTTDVYAQEDCDSFAEGALDRIEAANTALLDYQKKLKLAVSDKKAVLDMLNTQDFIDTAYISIEDLSARSEITGILEMDGLRSSAKTREQIIKDDLMELQSEALKFIDELDMKIRNLRESIEELKGTLKSEKAYLLNLRGNSELS